MADVTFLYVGQAVEFWVGVEEAGSSDLVEVRRWI
jgi:hypothetical protein